MDSYVAVYVDGDCDLEAVRVAGESVLRARAPYRHHPEPVGDRDLEIEVLEDGEFEPRRVEFPDGFLCFRCKIEVEFASDVGDVNRVNFIGALLQHLWARTWSAVAVCDLRA